MMPADRGVSGVVGCDLCGGVRQRRVVDVGEGKIAAAARI
jgi:hypothetical protein